VNRQQAFEKKRTCICCGAEATPLHRRPDEPIVMSIAFTITRSGRGKRVTRAAGSVRLCEACLIRANAGNIEDGLEFLGASLDRLGRCYSSLLDDEPDMDAPAPLPLLEGQQCLL
jgi:hypothetical protein